MKNINAFFVGIICLLLICSCDNSVNEKKTQETLNKINKTQKELEDKIKIIEENHDQLIQQLEKDKASQKLSLDEMIKGKGEIIKRLDASEALVKQLRKEMWTEAVDLDAFKKFKVDLDVPAIRVQTAKTSPVIDGKFDDVYKKQCQFMGFYPIKTISPNRNGKSDIKAYVLIDKEAFYILLRYETSSPHMMESSAQARDSALWEKDCIDIFIDPSGDGSEYYHIITNAAGALYDSKQSDTSWNPDIVVKCGTEKEKAFVMEMKIPLKDMGVKYEEIAKIWTFNIFFFIPKEDQAEPDIDLGWSPTGTDSSHVPEMFGKLWMDFSGRPKSKKKR